MKHRPHQAARLAFVRMTLGYSAADCHPLNEHVAKGLISIGVERPTGMKDKEFVQTNIDRILSVANIRVRKAAKAVAADAFLESYAWRKVRMEALKKWGARCQCCGASAATGAVVNVDHIKPRKLFPDLSLDINNLQVLCHDCNHGKGNWDQTDWRPPAAP